ncbi:MAG TPA: SGNH/GDSL hydrolase family protein [Armatimonadota bacterium]|nr:SGNH/GDSL hydrolase family protein [Armatimonadota bacterium]
MQYVSTDDIVACARGMRQARETALGLELVRFSDAALAIYREPESRALRSLCPAGVVLDLLTDSDVLYLKAQIGPGARQPAYFDLYVDGVFVGTLGSATPEEVIEGELHWKSTGTMRVTLYVPQCRMFGFREVALADGASWSPAPLQPTLLALGDSITQGMDAHHPSLIYPAVAARALGMGLYNCGVGGYVFDAASLPDPPITDPALITVAYGTNDWSCHHDVAHARDYLARVRTLYSTVPVVVLEPIWRTACDGDPAEPNSYTLADYRRELAAIVDEFLDVRYLPMSNLLPPGPVFLSDGTHPDSVGHITYGENLAKMLGRVLATESIR